MRELVRSENLLLSDIALAQLEQAVDMCTRLERLQANLKAMETKR